VVEHLLTRINNNNKKKIFSFDLIYTSSLNSIGVFCGDDVVVGLNIVFIEFVDDVRLPILKLKIYI
jgi:hypothetical protein